MLVFIGGNQGVGKTTLGKKLVGKGIFIETDNIYLEFVKKYLSYMYGDDIQKCINLHYKKLDKQSKLDFMFYLKEYIYNKIKGTFTTCVVEGWHMKEYMYYYNEFFSSKGERVKNLLFVHGHNVLIPNIGLFDRDNVDGILNILKY